MTPASRWSCNTSLGDIGSVCTITYTLANSSTLEALQVGETWLVGIDYISPQLYPCNLASCYLHRAPTTGMLRWPQVSPDLFFLHQTLSLAS